MTNQIKRDSFIFYRSFFETLEDLEDKQQLEIYKAIAEYSLNDKSIKLEGISKTIFRLIEPQLLANKKRFINGQKGAEHGIKGGRPKTPKKPLINPTLTPNKNNNNNNNLNSNENDNLKLPDFIDKNLLVAFFDFRESVATKKKPFTEKAKELLLKKLIKFEDNKKGNANLALENSIANSWIGLFESKDFQDQKPQSKITNKLAIELNKIIGFDLIIDTKINGYNELDIFFESKEGIQQLKDQDEQIKEKIKQKIASLKVEKYKLEVKNG